MLTCSLSNIAVQFAVVSIYLVCERYRPYPLEVARVHQNGESQSV